MDTIRKKRQNLLIRIGIFLFTAAVSAAVLPCGITNAHGLFGENTFSVVADSVDSENINKKSRKTAYRKRKGINVYNLWHKLRVCILCAAFLKYVRKLPRKATVITLKDRMNN